MRKSEWLLLLAAAIFFATGFAFYPYLPDQIASHWNAAGNVNGYMPRAWGVFLLPIVFILIALVFMAIPRMDPKRDNIAKFRKYFDYFVEAFAAVFYYIYLLSLLWNIGYQFNFTLFLIPALAALFYLIGVLLPHTELNWTIGIRTPWTISSDAVWKKTHIAGGLAFKICGVIALLGTGFPNLALWFLVVPIIVSTIGLVIYSYMLYERGRK